MGTTDRFLLGRGREVLDEDDLQALEGVVREVREMPARKVLVRRGELVNTSTLLVEGFLCRYMDDREGYRQLVAMHVPGDFVDLHAYPMKRLDHDIASLSACKIAVIEHRALTEITEPRPRLTRMLWYSTLLDAAQHREWIFRLGRLGAEGRIAHFMAELHTRLRMVGLGSENGFDLPILQSDLAEAVGLTSVHVNRTLRTLREEDVLTFRNGQVAIQDIKKLHTIAEFEPDYLYGEWSRDLEER
jgi:CRP-like cAMP-binding protein